MVFSVTPQATAQGVTLKIIVTTQQAPGVEAVVSDFLASDLGTGVSGVEVVKSGDRADNQLTYLTTQMTTGSSEFDVLGLDTVWTAQFAANNWIDELDIPTSEMNNFYGGMVDSSTYNGKYYAYPYFMNLGVLFYRADLLAANGITVSSIATWEGFKTAANTILDNTTNPDLTGYVGQLDAYEGGVCNFIEWLGSNGVDSIFDENGNPDLNNTKNIETMTFLKGLVAPRYTGVQNTSYIISRDDLTSDEGSSVTKWTAGNAIFMRQWTFAYGNSIADALLNHTDGSGNYDQFGITAMPTHTGAADEKSSVVGGAVLAIPSTSTHKDLALNLIKYLGQEKAQIAELTNCSNFPALKAAFDNLPTGYEWVADFKTAAEKTLARPVDPDYSQFSTEISRNFNNILGGSVSIGDGLANMDTAINDITGKGGAGATTIPGYALPFLVLTFLGTVALLYRKRH
ncbi:MAG: extracellular solute-binding protein [Promethearchaeota archaeon]